MKQCADCKKQLPVSEFHIQSRKSDGSIRYHAYCKVCRKERAKRDRQTKSVPCACGQMKYASSVLCKSCRLKAHRRGGAESPSWRGGESVTSKGYVTILDVATGKRHLKHRWIMEQHLGRELLPDESIHHKNGVRDDNRIENLELWSSSHPAGQRVEDLVDWAKSILSRYGA